MSHLTLTLNHFRLIRPLTQHTYLWVGAEEGSPVGGQGRQVEDGAGSNQRDLNKGEHGSYFSGLGSRMIFFRLLRCIVFHAAPTPDFSPKGLWLLILFSSGQLQGVKTCGSFRLRPFDYLLSLYKYFFSPHYINCKKYIKISL